MADNPFDPQYRGLLDAFGVQPRRNGLLDYIGTPAITTTQPSHGLAGLLSDSQVQPSQTDFLPGSGSAFEPLFDNPLAKILTATSPSLPATPLFVAPEVKRKAFFSFQFDDIMRVNNVRNAWKITHADSSSNRSFYDSSLWETRKVTKPEVVKQLIRSGVLNTSAVCVLVGSNTWSRRWVRYEIARAIIDPRGLLAVHINNINHHQTRGPHIRGRNPLSHMGIAKLQRNALLPPQYYLYEMSLVLDGYGGTIEQWTAYGDYVAPVTKPAWLTDPSLDHVMPLSTNTSEYDYINDHGHRNIGSWIDKAAKQAGR